MCCLVNVGGSHGPSQLKGRRSCDDESSHAGSLRTRTAVALGIQAKVSHPDIVVAPFEQHDPSAQQRCRQLVAKVAVEGSHPDAIREALLELRDSIESAQVATEDLLDAGVLAALASVLAPTDVPWLGPSQGRRALALEVLSSLLGAPTRRDALKRNLGSFQRLVPLILEQVERHEHASPEPTSLKHLQAAQLDGASPSESESGAASGSASGLAHVPAHILQQEALAFFALSALTKLARLETLPASILSCGGLPTLVKAMRPGSA